MSEDNEITHKEGDLDTKLEQLDKYYENVGKKLETLQNKYTSLKKMQDALFSDYRTLRKEGVGLGGEIAKYIETISKYNKDLETLTGQINDITDKYNALKQAEETVSKFSEKYKKIKQDIDNIKGELKKYGPLLNDVQNFEKVLSKYEEIMKEKDIAKVSEDLDKYLVLNEKLKGVDFDNLESAIGKLDSIRGTSKYNSNTSSNLGYYVGTALAVFGGVLAAVAYTDPSLVTTTPTSIGDIVQYTPVGGLLTQIGEYTIGAGALSIGLQKVYNLFKKGSMKNSKNSETSSKR